DGRTDLVFNSTCQKNAAFDSTCTAGDANLVYSGLASGSGTFTLGALQTYGGSGWSDYPISQVMVGDVNGDGRSDLVWSSMCQAAGHTHHNLVVAGLGNAAGTFERAANLTVGSGGAGY